MAKQRQPGKALVRGVLDSPYWFNIIAKLWHIGKAIVRKFVLSITAHYNG
jgi:hypothetical protein